MRVFTTRPFQRFARKERIADSEFRAAVARAEAGLVDADLGGGLLKQRVARQGQGRAGGYRTILAYRRGNRSVFIHGFAKRDQENIDARELRELRDAARIFLGLDDTELAIAATEGRLIEVEHDG
jgi:hypothetical protein